MGCRTPYRPRVDRREVSPLRKPAHSHEEKGPAYWGRNDSALLWLHYIDERQFYRGRLTDWSHCQVSVALRSQVQFWAVTAAASPRVVRAVAFACRPRKRSERTAAFAGSDKMRPSCSFWISSETPANFDVITGRPQAMASATGRPNESSKLGLT
jgi:hypothetical protein